MTHYDLAVVGTGSGNTILGREFRDQRVALVESGAFGGTCLNYGCIPTKTLLYSAKIYDYAGHGDKYGVSVEGRSIDHAKVVARGRAEADFGACRAANPVFL